jgi:competence protein ComEC
MISIGATVVDGMPYVTQGAQAWRATCSSRSASVSEGPMNRWIVALLLLAPLAGLVIAAAPPAKTLDFYTIDVEGGKSMLVVSPSGESMLFDVGWPQTGNRDASTEVIVDAVKKAGLTQIDYLVLSHFDVDHIGDVPALASQIPIRHIVDHGSIQLPPTPAAAPPAVAQGIATPAPARGGGGPSARDRFDAYAAMRQTIGHTVVGPGDTIPLKGVRVDVVAAGGKLRSTPLKGGGAANPLCAANPQAEVLDRDVEDNQSVGLLFTLGNFRMLDLADLEAHYSHELVCPANLIGQVDVYHVNVHGQFKGMAPELVGALWPAVAIVGNGSRKGGDPATWPILRAAPGLQDIWQVHYSEAGTADTNPPADFIANLAGLPDTHQLIKLSVLPDGTYTITNTRNGFSKTYHASRR